MLRKSNNHTVILSWCIFSILLCSIAVTIVSDNTISDGVSITVSVIAGIALALSLVTVLIDVIRSICDLLVSLRILFIFSFQF